MVGTTQKALTSNYFFTSTATYLKDFFPDFLKHNPFDEPEYYAYPFKHITLDHLFFVYMCHDRIEMLKYADEKEMNILDFCNWATNHAFSYNEEVGKEVYSLSIMKYLLPYIKNNTYKKKWSDDFFKF